MPQLEDCMEDLLLSNLNPAPGDNEHGTDGMGEEETDAPCVPAALAERGHTPWALSSPASAFWRGKRLFPMEWEN